MQNSDEPESGSIEIRETAETLARKGFFTTAAALAAGGIVGETLGAQQADAQTVKVPTPVLTRGAASLQIDSIRQAIAMQEEAARGAILAQSLAIVKNFSAGSPVAFDFSLNFSLKWGRADRAQ